jgi:3-hydroxymyristoyl/3-hydroxydecanoyl-(acyl carrier protein) dehydratase
MIENRAANIPHQGPMRWLDEATAQADGWILGTHRIRSDHPFVINGRMVRSAIIELVAQTAAAGSQTLTGGQRGGAAISGMLIALGDVRFYGDVFPGDSLALRVRVMQQLGSMFRCQGRVLVQSSLICEGTFSFFISAGP